MQRALKIRKLKAERVMEKPVKTLVLLDGNALIHRAYHALPPLTTKSGEVVHAVYGFTMTLLSVLEKFRPDYIAASFDLAGPTFRDELYKEYKATRVKAPDDLYAQIPRVKEVVAAFNIPIYEMAGFEADDCVGTIAKQAAKTAPTPHPRGLESSPRAGEQEKNEDGVNVIIVTGDNDTLQLVDERIKVFSIRKGLKDLVLYDEAAVVAKYGFKPEQLPDYKGLAGDQSDNIPGVKGIGEKSATDLLKQFGTLERIYDHLADVKEALRKKLEADRETAFLSKKLGTIDIAAPVTVELEKCLTHDFDHLRVGELFKELGFFSLLKRIPGTTGDQPPTTDNRKTKKIRSMKIQTAEELEKWLAEHTGEVAVWIEEEKESLFGSGIAAVELAADDAGQVSVVWNEEMKPALKTFFENERRPKICFDTKYLMHLLAKEDMRLVGVTRDVSIINYLLSAGGRNGFGELLLQELGMEGTETRAAALYALNVKLGARIKEIAAGQPEGKTLIDVYGTIELPLIEVLFRMEEAGIRLNVAAFEKMAKEMTVELAHSEKKIYEFAGKEFNVNSPKQLSDILFVELKIPTTNIKKTKTGLSTAATELEKLKEYPIVLLIGEYRELFKLKTTYLDVIPGLVDGRSRVHTTYHQTVAATGRLSSSDPNLQNIPARQAWSERIRGAFEAEAGHLLVGADYSQIELRIAAHLSGDENLVGAFARGEDVHRKTAAVVFGVAPEAVTDDMRRRAKVFNFGILYGMGAFGLAQAGDFDQKEAAEFIAAYFTRFSGVAKYLETSKTFAREHGYVETELGRRRFVPEIQSDNVQVARSGERMAVNMPVQGLAADIMKLAMLAADQMAQEKYRESAMLLLQVHDEIIFEVEESVAEAFADDLKKTMENIYTLKVPLIVAVSIGKNWGEI